ncbi:MAG: FG-GAP repeat protein [Planctomycetota bacterium]
MPRLRTSLALLLAASATPVAHAQIVQEAYLKASNTQASDSFGSVAVDGDTIVVGAPREDGSSAGVNGDESDEGAPNAGAAYVFVRSGSTWVQQAYLKASVPDLGDLFGSAVALDGDTIAVAVPNEDGAAIGVDGNAGDDSAPDAGAVVVFVRNGSIWVQQAYIKASNTDAGDQFGTSVAIDGDTIVVGAKEERSSATGVNGNESDDSALGAGAVYVFVRNGATWTQQAYLKASNSSPELRFGSAVDVSGDTIVVGASSEASAATGVDGDQSNTGAPSSGAAYVFVRNGTTWSQQAYLKASNTDPMDLFGGSVAIDGDTIVVGAVGEDGGIGGVNAEQSDDSAGYAGAAYVFVRVGAVWSQQAYLKAAFPEGTPFFGDAFGRYVDACEDFVAVAATYDSSSSAGIDGNQLDNGLTFSGAVHLFERKGSTWRPAGFVKASNPGGLEYFGEPSLDGTTLVVGCPQEDSSATGVGGDQSDDSAPQAGAAYVFDLDADWAIVQGCGGNPARLVAPSAPAAVGTSVGVEVVADAHMDGVVATYFGAKGNAPYGCGTQLAPSEELLIALVPFPTILGLAAMTNGTATAVLSLPPNPGLVGIHVTLQSVLVDTATFASEFSTGLEFEIRP